MNDFSQVIIAAAQARRAQSIAFLGRLIKAQRSGESAVQQCFADHLTEAGCQVESLRYAPAEVRMQHEFATGEVAATEERCSLIARLRGEGAGRSLIFFGHPDGEPVMNPERWQHDPYAATVSDGRMYGWGVADDLACCSAVARVISAWVSGLLLTSILRVLLSVRSLRGPLVV